MYFQWFLKDVQLVKSDLSSEAFESDSTEQSEVK